MALRESWVQIISTVVSWVKENSGPTKKELKIKIEDLQEQVSILAKGNTDILNNMSVIINAILSDLKVESQNIINADQIVYIGSNDGSVNATINTRKNEVFPVSNQNAKNFYANHFFATDEEIALTRYKDNEQRSK